MSKSKIYLLSDDDFIKLVKSCYSYSEILRNLNLCDSGGTSSKTLKQRINELHINISHFKKQYEMANIKQTKNFEEVFKEKSNTTRFNVKKRVIKEHLIEYKCEICGNTGEWNDNELILQLDHINGINDDNRLENLRFLCPNCHSQTDTYANKRGKKKYYCKTCGCETKTDNGICKQCSSINQRKVERPIRDELKKLIRNHTFVELSQLFNVSDIAIRKWCKQYNLPYKSRIIKLINDDEWINI